MTNPEWGVKRLCPETGKRFYDLNADPIISPYTGKVVPIETGDRRLDDALASKKAKADNDAVDDDDLLVEDDAVDVDEDLLESDEDDTVALDDLADVAVDDED